MTFFNIFVCLFLIPLGLIVLARIYSVFRWLISQHTKEHHPGDSVHPPTHLNTHCSGGINLLEGNDTKFLRGDATFQGRVSSPYPRPSMKKPQKRFVRPSSKPLKTAIQEAMQKEMKNRVKLPVRRSNYQGGRATIVPQPPPKPAEPPTPHRPAEPFTPDFPVVFPIVIPDYLTPSTPDYSPPSTPDPAPDTFSSGGGDTSGAGSGSDWS